MTWPLTQYFKVSCPECETVHTLDVDELLIENDLTVSFDCPQTQTIVYKELPFRQVGVLAGHGVVIDIQVPDTPEGLSV